MNARLTLTQPIKLTDDIEAKIINIKDQGETLRIGNRTFTATQLRRKCGRLRKRTANKHLTFLRAYGGRHSCPASKRLYDRRIKSKASIQDIDATIARLVANNHDRPGVVLAAQVRSSPTIFIGVRLALFSGIG